jgi:hypothetical protein
LHPQPALTQRSRALLRYRRRIATTVVSTLTVTLAALAPALPAHASPTIAEIKAQIATLNNQIETIVEEYNGVTTRLDADRKKAAKLQAAIGPAQLQAIVAQQHIGTIAHDMYVSGPMSGWATLLDVDSTNALIDEMGSLNAIARAQHKAAVNASALATTYQNQKASLSRR